MRSSAVRREKPHWEPTPSSENAPVARSKPLPRGPEMETRTPAGPPRVAHPRVPPSKTRIVESDADQPVEPAGTRITRTITTGPDGRTYITERKTTTVSNAPIPIRRAEPVEPRHREGFFQRLFRDDRDD